MIHAQTVDCDGCDRQVWVGPIDPAFATPKKIREQLAREGWAFYRISARRRIDLCPQCVIRRLIPEVAW